MYQAIIANISVRPHPNADNLQLGTVAGYQVIVGTDVENGQPGIFFPPDGQLSEEYAKRNKLMKEDGGYLDKKRRVRALRLRGERSEGLWMPLRSLQYIPLLPTEFPVGLLFTEIAGVSVCNKYETPKTRSQKQSKGRTHQKENRFFKKHYGTPQWRFFKDSIPADAFVSVTEKLHGTSGRYGRVLVETPQSWWQRLLRVYPKPTYRYLIGTRNTILTDAKVLAGTSFYGKEEFRFNSVRGLELHEGEILYFELVGYSKDTALIMGAQPVKDPELVKVYGTEMSYTYGQVPGTVGLYVYRITRTSHKGVVTELSWMQVKQRCAELGVAVVPELDQQLSQEGLEAMVARYTEGPSTLDASHIREGVVVRVESGHGTYWYKNKSFTFGVLEGYIKDNDDYVDTEEIS